MIDNEVQEILSRLEREVSLEKGSYEPISWLRIKGKRLYLFAKVELPDGSIVVWGIPRNGMIIKSSDVAPRPSDPSGAALKTCKALYEMISKRR